MIYLILEDMGNS